MTGRLLITGAGGNVGTMLRHRLHRPLRLLDISELPDTGDGAELVQASITDLDAMSLACKGVDAIVHLGGLSLEDRWAQILPVNIGGTYSVLEAARRAGVPRVIFASSNHAVGFHRGPAAPDNLFPRPDTFYGVSKVAGEALGSLYHDRYGLDVICLRIGSCFERPKNARMLSTWLSPGDCARLIEAAVSVPSPGFRVVWGVSANTRNRWSLDAARAIGYRPRDDAEDYAAEVEALTGDYDHYVGGGFCSPELDQEI